MGPPKKKNTKWGGKQIKNWIPSRRWGARTFSKGFTFFDFFFFKCTHTMKQIKFTVEKVLFTGNEQNEETLFQRIKKKEKFFCFPSAFFFHVCDCSSKKYWSFSQLPAAMWYEWRLLYLYIYSTYTHFIYLYSLHIHTMCICVHEAEAKNWIMKKVPFAMINCTNVFRYGCLTNF